MTALDWIFISVVALIAALAVATGYFHMKRIKMLRKRWRVKP